MGEIETRETQSLGIVRIETCEDNRAHQSDEAARQVCAHTAGVLHREWACLGHCHNCFKKPFALVDDRILLEADSAEELYSLLLDTLATLKSPPSIK
ncbi:DUF1450 domain-containing protein [Ferroacidibacillus organovorans]|uniref:DUF1450 domain-containing protein n=1 Tax=Ferroacidibacillus organovorans TaxID=1765683 RepID=A0A124IW21_9BACL|nr:DUF1450 domain-containing protein [Ferroacidibacillus organovorans]KUO95989.1 hypothetical protein ATW55_02620 [Ferroacidibacillus organovorans]